MFVTEWITEYAMNQPIAVHCVNIREWWSAVIESVHWCRVMVMQTIVA